MTKPDTWDAYGRGRVNERWTQCAVSWNTAMTDTLLSAAAITPDSAVLDLAAGSGDPAFTIAARLTAGSVMALDRSHASISLAEVRARQLGLESKIRCVQADAQAIPLAQSSVNRVTCRCAVMFFPDTRLVLSEVLRVLKPGGRVAFLAWGPFEQPFFDATVGVVLRLVKGAEMPNDAREMFRFASAGSLGTELRDAGFCDVREELMTVPRIWSGSPEELWAYQQVISTPCHPLFNSIPKSLQPSVDAEVSTALARFRSGSVLSVPVNVIIATGERAR